MPIPAYTIATTKDLVTVKPSDSFEEALTKMITYDLSQLPVVNTEYAPLGLITSDSIARALMHFGTLTKDLRVSDVFERILPSNTFAEEEDLIYLIDRLLELSAILLVSSGKLKGIITEYDTNKYFRKRAKEIVLLEEIENYLKAYLRASYGSTEKLQEAIDQYMGSTRKRTEASLSTLEKAIKEVCLRKGVPVLEADTDIKEIIEIHFPSKEQKSFDDLSMGEFIDLSKKNWPKLKLLFGVEQEGISEDKWYTMMNNVREIRNNIFHFRSDLSPVDRQKLDFCASWFKNCQLIPSDKEQDINDVEDTSDEKTVGVIDTGIVLNENTPFKLLTTLGRINTQPVAQEVEKSIEEKYLPFISFLTNNIGNNVNFFDTSIDAIEKIIKQPLPKAARETNSWWHDYSPQTRQWVKVGWSVGSVNLNTQQVSFYRWSYLIELTNPEQTDFWTNKLQCTEEELTTAIARVGNLSAEVEHYIKQNKVK
jgi:CBS domain-containing protein